LDAKVFTSSWIWGGDSTIVELYFMGNFEIIDGVFTEIDSYHQHRVEVTMSQGKFVKARFI
jgi:hypothetical protein